MNIKKNCHFCNIEFMARPTPDRPNRGKYCSVPCWKKDQQTTKECIFCHKTFSGLKSVLKDQKLCSLQCTNKYKVGLNSGDRAYNWKGGKVLNKGYIEIRLSSFERARRHKVRMPEHRLVMEKHLRRRLMSKEVVHHINGDKLDNRIENLKLFGSISEHIKHIHFNSCPQCGFMFRS